MGALIRQRPKLFLQTIDKWKKIGGTKLIVDELLHLIEKQSRLKSMNVSRVCISLCYTAVMLDTGHVGLCHTPTEDIAHTHWGHRLDFHGSKALETARLANSFDMIGRTVGVATLNALSQYVMDSEGYKRQLGVDLSDAIKAKKEDIAAVVGYIRPLVGKLRARVREVYVFERNPQLRGDALPETFVDLVLPKADVVFISGSSLVNGSLDKLLELSGKAKFVGVGGPTASMLPDPLLERGVNIVAGVRATGQEVMDAVAEAKPFVAFKELVEKYVITRGTKKRRPLSPVQKSMYG
jgi:hypothetical protein